MDGSAGNSTKDERDFLETVIYAPGNAKRKNSI